MNQLKKLNEIYDEIHKQFVEVSKLSWTQYTAGYDFGVQEAYEKAVEKLKDKKNYEAIQSCLELELSPVDSRRVEIVQNMFQPYHLSKELNTLDSEIKRKVNELSKVLNTFRYSFNGQTVSSVDLSQILSSNPDREMRKKAYFARNQINKAMIDAGFLDLLELRKEYAKAYGSENFVTHMLEKNELDPSTFEGWKEQLHESLPKMNQARTRFAQEYLKDDQIMPWDEAYIDSKVAPSLNKQVDMSEYYTNIQELFNIFDIDISKFNITYDIFPRANKSEWGYNFPVETAKDSRILANVKNRYFEYGVLLHETGHAVHSFLLDPEEKILNKGVSGIISEGIANLFQGFLYSPVFYEKFFEDKNTVERQFTNLKEYKKLNSLRAVNRIFLDHKMYTTKLNSLDDVHQLYWNNQKELLDENPFDMDPPWAYIIHFTTHPIYLHNYFMGDVTCEMLSKVFERKFDASMVEKPKEFGQFLINEVIKPSGTYKYNDLFKKISGEEFSLKYMLD
ncbi:hypothetical protein GCM10008967_17550 [Bacillus carboniphilus]|uniref:Peptidase M3A/M3B catalytic domain-containing protein n=1 Tax=Bacillus carboniphilus TaxID=86663 RepID=A0ABP3FXG4_9BACI